MKALNLVGKTFGRLVVLSSAGIKNHRSFWNCRCTCGGRKEAMGKTLLSGGTTSCGCLQREKIHECCFRDIAGERFSSLTAQASFYRNGKTYWKCLCDCGEPTIVEATKLKSGHTKSCGCLHAHSAKIRAIERNKRMRGSKHPSWRADLSDDERKRRIEGRFSDPKLNRWRKKVYERDHYTCQKCKDNRGGNLVAHHIYSWAYYPTLRYVTLNGITLCDECHKSFHNVYGRKKNTRKQLTIFMSKKNPNPSPKPPVPPKIVPKPLPPRPAPIPPKREEGLPSKIQ